jgi:hypothetical protein
MAMPARKIPPETVVEDSATAIKYIHSDVSETKTVIRELRQDARRIEAKLDATGVRLGEKNDATAARLDGKIEVTAARLERKLDATAVRLQEKIDATATRLDAKIENTATRLGNKIENTATRLEGKIDATGARLEQSDARNNSQWEALHQELRRLSVNMEKGFSRLTRWSLTLYIGPGTSILAIVARGLKWI